MNMRRSTMPAETAPVLALDIRLMNITSMLLITGLVVASVGVVLWWMLRHPVFAISAISVRGDIRHNNAVTLSEPMWCRDCRGGFFTVDLDASAPHF
jgi:cell division protein FtsQ